MQRIIQTLELNESEEALQAYLKAHDEIWPEIVEGIRSVGIETMDIYRLGYTLVMVVELPDDICFDEAMQRLATLPRQQEWEEFVGRYQKCDPKSTSSGKWKRLTRFFQLPQTDKGV